MVLMALDHVRDYFGDPLLDPTDPAKASVALFFTRWVTHLCAPTFVFLAGASAYLSAARKGKRETTAFLVKRGLWLIVLELTVIRLAWVFDFTWSMTWLQVIWALGVSMIFLAALAWLPMKAIAAIGVVLVAGHNLFDTTHVSGGGLADFGWAFLHEQASFRPLEGVEIGVFYPVLPWIGVMALGWVFGSQVERPLVERKRVALTVGVILLAAFVVLRTTGAYGDPHSWAGAEPPMSTVMAFLRLEKYPPSLQFLLATLGIMMLLYAALHVRPVPAWHPLLVFGRVPLFYYIVHLYVIHVLALLALGWKNGAISWSHDVFAAGGAGWSLPSVHATWLVVVVVLYAPSRWFAAVKARYGKWWLSYL